MINWLEPSTFALRLQLLQRSRIFRLLLAMLLPFIAAATQWELWSFLPPLTWLFFYPTVFFSASIGGLLGGLLATMLSVFLGIYFFIPPQFSFAIQDSQHFLSIAIFCFMGVLFSLFHAHLHKIQAELLRVNALNLEASHARLQEALDAANAGLWEWDLRTNQYKWSDGLHRLYGLQAENAEPSYDAWQASIHANDQAAVVAKLSAAVKEGKDLKLEWRVADDAPDGERWLMATGKPHLQADGSTALYRGIVVDITQRKQMEQSLRDREQRLNFVLETLNFGVWSLNLRTLKAHRTLLHDKIFGYSSPLSEWSFDKFLEHVVPEDRPYVEQCFQSANKNLSDWDVECRIRRADGEIRWIWAKGKHQFDEQGRPISLDGVVKDIQQRKDAELAIKALNAQLTETQRLAGVGSWFWDIASNTQRWSVETYNIYQLDATQPPPSYQEIANYFTAEGWRQISQAVERALSDGEAYECDAEMIRPGGGHIWITARGAAIRNEQGRIVQLHGTVQDITQRKQAELATQRSEQRFRRLFQESPLALGLIDQNGVIVNTNSRFEQLFGYTRAEVPDLAAWWLCAYPDPDYRAHAQKNWNAAVANAAALGADIEPSEYQVTCRGGEVRDVIISGIAVGAEFMATFYDVTERKKLEREVIAAKEKLEAALDSMTDAVFISDSTGRFIEFNDAFATFHKFRNKQECAALLTDYPSFLEVCSSSGEPLALEQWAVPRALRGETSGGAEFVLRRKDTGETWVGNYSYAPIRNPEGAIVGSVVAARDITERKQNEAELERYRDQLEQLIEERTLELSAARNEAERLTAVKSAFLANMSHEIRSPLNAVLGICYLLEQRQLDNEARQLLSKMHGAGNSLLALINDILDFSKIEAGRIEIEHAPFKLMDVLEQLASLMSVVASDKDLELIINPPILMLDKLMGDSLRLQQVLTNLVSNAIKFTDRGEVELSIRTERKSDRQISLRFTVRDTGIGISPEQQRDIFSAFSQADATITRRFGGSGLGLCISRQLVKLMGGDLQVKSQLGLGSEFWFELTFQKDLRADRTPSYLSRLRLLVADDSATCREALVNTAASLGWIADVVNSGATALHRMAVRLDAQKPYDVVILDWKMPEMDGLATAILIQETLKIKYARFKKPPIVIMVTAHAREDILQSPGIDQVDAVLSKPVTPSSLYNTITDIIEKRDCIKLFDTGSALPLSTKYLPGIRILVVDDSDINREVAQRILEAQGALVSLAVDGRDALQRLTAAPDSFDIVLMDVQMPGMDGYSASRLIRDNPRWSGLPIIALTAGAFESFRNAAFEAGMNDFVSKPFSVEELLSIIRRYTGNPPPVGQHPDNNMERLGQSPGDRPDYPDETPLDLPGVDLGKGLSHWGEEKIYAKFLNKFANSYKNAGHEIAELLRLDDRVGAAALTHKLKGVAGNLALKDAEECLSRLEALVQAGTAAIESVEPLQKAIDEVCASIAIWTNAHAGAGDQLPPLTASADIPGEPRLILEQLLCALDQDDPDGAEPYISQLQGRIPAADFNLIREQLDEFAFRGAEETIRILIQRLNFD